MLWINACDIISSTNKSVFVLVDVSQTYSVNVESAIRSTRMLTADLQTNDWIGFAQISSCSFSDSGLIFRENLPSTPSKAATTKTRIFSRLDAYTKEFKSTNYTDIKGALRYATNELQQTKNDRKYIIIFSDMIEDVSSDCQTQNLEVDLSGYTVIASNIIKSRKDERNPQSYFDRLREWKEFVETSGGEWAVTTSSEQISELISY